MSTTNILMMMAKNRNVEKIKGGKGTKNQEITIKIESIRRLERNL